MDLKQRIKNTFEKVKVMQLATVRNGQPWCCNVHVYIDDELSIYWVSAPTRRHSKELADDPRVAAAAAVKQDKPVLGLQVEGTAKAVEDAVIAKRIMRLYGKRHGSEPAWVDDVAAGRATVKLYCLKPTKVAIFDPAASPDSPQQILEL